MRLDGRTALITGAGSGIGRALAVEAARRGLELYLAGRRLSKLEQTRSSLGAGAIAHCIEADVTTPQGRQAIRQAVGCRNGGLDILVNNAGAIFNGDLDESDDAEVSRMVETNLVAPTLLTRDLLPLLKRAERPRIVNVGSVYGDIAAPGFAVYAATKFGLRGLSDALRRELAGQGIGVTYVAPRATRTEGVGPISETLERQGVAFDEPAKVAAWIWAAVEKEKRSAYPPSAERLFVALQRVLPALIDRSLAKRS